MEQLEHGVLPIWNSGICRLQPFFFSFLSFFFLKIYLSNLKGKFTEREGEEVRERSSFCWFTPQMVTVVRAGLIQWLEPKVSFRCPKSLQGPKVLGCLAPFSQADEQEAGFQVEQPGLEQAPQMEAYVLWCVAGLQAAAVPTMPQGQPNWDYFNLYHSCKNKQLYFLQIYTFGIFCKVSGPNLINSSHQLRCVLPK